MDINNILKGVECSCGKTHQCDIEYVYVEKGAIARLDTICGQKENILVVADENTYSAAGEKVEQALGGRTMKKVIFSGETVLIPNEDAIDRVRAEISGIDMILGIGSGVIQDLCKYVSFFARIPYIIVATAPSMDGYASSGAAMILKGMKETVPAGLPKAIIADIDVLKDAPLDMIKAGYGDIMGKYSALCDWALSHKVNNEYFCQYIYDVVFEMVKSTLNVADGLLNRDDESIKILTEALIVVGIMISFAGSSRPASGSEHHLSHFFEIVGIINNKPYFVHGIDVAYSTVITAQLREEILKHEFPNSQYRLSRNDYEKKMLEIYSVIADECIALQDRVGLYDTDRISIYKHKENEIRNILSEMPTAEEIEKIIGRVGLSMEDFYKMYDAKDIENAVLYAKDLKDRYTVLWMYYDFLRGE